MHLRGLQFTTFIHLGPQSSQILYIEAATNPQGMSCVFSIQNVKEYPSLPQPTATCMPSQSLATSSKVSSFSAANMAPA